MNPAIDKYDKDIAKVARILTDGGADREQLAKTLIPLINKLEVEIRECNTSCSSRDDYLRILDISTRMNCFKSYLGKPASMLNSPR